MKSKTCANTECAKVYLTKNPKKKFCSIICKNRAAYLFRQKYYEYENEAFKARRKNIQILEYLVHQKRTKITLSELKILGFDHEIAFIPSNNECKQTVFRYGNIYLILLTATEYEIKTIKHV